MLPMPLVRTSRQHSLARPCIKQVRIRFKSEPRLAGVKAETIKTAEKYAVQVSVSVVHVSENGYCPIFHYQG